MWHDQIIQYGSASGNQLLNVSPFRVTGFGGAQDDLMRFARVIRIGQTGTVERVQRLMP